MYNRKTDRPLRATALAALLALLLPACSRQEAAGGCADEELHGSISVSGAFALYPLTVQWANDFQEMHPKVRMNISAGGAGKGMTDVLNGMVDFAMLSREPYDQERSQGAVAFTVGRDAVIPDINAANPLRDQILRRGITAEDARKFWVTGEYRTWGDFLGNGDPHPVHVYTRSDACGAAQTWAAWFGAVQEDLGGTAVYSDPGIAKAVGDDIWAIGFNNMAYAYDPATDRPYADLAIIPVDLDGNGEIDGDEDCCRTKAQLVEAIKEDRFPAPPCRNLYLVCQGVPGDPACEAFLRYILSPEGQRLNEPAGFVSISGETRRHAERQLRVAKRRENRRDNTTGRFALGFAGILAFFLLVVGYSYRIPVRGKRRMFRERLAEGVMLGLTLLAIALLVAMIGGLFAKTLPILREHSVRELLTSSEWQPLQGKFGFRPFIAGSVAVTLLSLLISVPVALLTAVFLTEYAPRVLCNLVYPALDILASIPSVIYGLWGILILIPLWGYSLLTASLVLCVMVLPLMVSLFVELFRTVPRPLREASDALGATPWQTTRNVVLRKSRPGIIATVVLAMSKALGETIAVMMVCGSVPAMPRSLFRGFYTLPALIGNNYGEMASIPLYESAIMFAALLLLVLVVLFNLLSRVVLYRIEKTLPS